MAYIPFSQSQPFNGASRVFNMAGYVLLAVVAMMVSVPAAIATFGGQAENAPVVVSDAR